VDQACRLFHVDRATCLRLLEQLVAEGTLYKNSVGAYCIPVAERKRRA
jgi:hypothetical protein